MIILSLWFYLPQDMPFIWEELRRSLQGNILFCMWMIGRRCDEEKPVLRYSRMEKCEDMDCVFGQI
jgi:hypothetical protein